MTSGDGQTTRRTNPRTMRLPGSVAEIEGSPAGPKVGAFFEAHREEALALVRHVASREQKEHPLNRIMGIEETPTGVIVTTTDIHSPQRIAEALRHAYQGEFKVNYGHDEYTVRVSWTR